MKLLIVFLFVSIAYSQSGIVASGNDNYTVGAGLVELQIPVVKDVKLSVTKFEIPVEPEKPKLIKKKSFIEKIIELIKKLINKNK